MKAFPAMKMIGGALIVLASLNVYAQGSDAAAPRCRGADRQADQG